MADGLERCLAEMADRDVDVLLLGRECNARFVSEATRLWLAGTRAFAPSCVVVGATGQVHLLSITDDGFPRNLRPPHLYPMSWNPVNIIGSVVAIDGVSSARRVGVDGLTPMWEQLIGAALPDAELVDGEAVMRAARRVKTSTELDGIRSAVGVAHRALEATIEALRPGISERELVGVFAEHMARLGTSTPAFEGTFCIVDDGSGARRLSSDRVIEEGDLVAMSVGALVGGWEGSFARTWPSGRPTAEQHARWLQWQSRWTALVDRCGGAVRAGDLRALDGVRVHGVGLGYEALADDDEITAGMVVALELATAGMLGQDLFHMTDDGPEILTTFAYPTFAS